MTTRPVRVANCSGWLYDRFTGLRDALVMEASRLTHDIDSIGTLLRIDGRPPDERYVIEPLHAPRTEQGWRNAQFVSLPTYHVSSWATP